MSNDLGLVDFAVDFTLHLPNGVLGKIILRKLEQVGKLNFFVPRLRQTDNKTAFVNHAV